MGEFKPEDFCVMTVTCKRKSRVDDCNQQSAFDRNHRGVRMFNLAAGETVKALYSSSAINIPKGKTCQAQGCSRTVHRVIVVESPTGEGLQWFCGLHFVEACLNNHQLHGMESDLLLRRMQLARVG
jgi:hypothetical protein